MYLSVANFLQKKFNFDAHYFLKGGFWLSLTQVVTIIGGLLTSVLFAHYLTPADFGIYRYLIGLSALVAAFSLTGLAQSILQASAKKYYGFYIETIRTNLLYSIGILLAGIAGFGYYYIKGNTLLAIGCLLIALLQPIISSFGNTPSYLQGRRRYRDSTLLMSLKTAFITLTLVITIFITQSVVILFTVFLLSSALVNFFGHIILKPAQTTTTPKEIFDSYKSYAIHTSLRNLIANVANRLDTIVVFTQLGATELAIYTIATLVPEQIKTSFKNLANLLLPKYAQSNDISLLRKSVPKRSLQMFFLLVFCTTVYVIISPALLTFIFPSYPEAVLLSQITVLAFPSFIFLIPYNILQSSLDKTRLYHIINAGSAFQIFATIVGVSIGGLFGAIIAKVISRYFYLILTYYYFYK